MTTTSLDEALNEMVRTLSEKTPSELSDYARMIERAYVHILIERQLRVDEGMQVSGVSYLDGAGK